MDAVIIINYLQTSRLNLNFRILVISSEAVQIENLMLEIKNLKIDFLINIYQSLTVDK